MERILILDDSPIMRDLMVDYLSDLGYDVVATEDPAEARREADRKTFAVCICDKHLAGFDGSAVIRDLAPDFIDMRFILTDSLPNRQTEERMMSDRCRYLSKPFELEQLRDAVQASLQPISQ